MNTFEDKLHTSAHRLMAQDNKRMHVPQNPLIQKKKIIYRQAKAEKQVVSASIQEEPDIPTCTSIQCDGINYSILATN